MLMRRRRSVRRHRWIKIPLGIFVVFVVANLAFAALHWHRALPNTYLGRDAVGGQQWSTIEVTPISDVVHPAIILHSGAVQVSSSLQNLGVHIVVPRNVDQTGIRRWLPFLSLVSVQHLPFTVMVDQTAFTKAVLSLSAQFDRAPISTHLIWGGTDFAIAPAIDGYQIDQSLLKTGIARSVQAGQTQVAVPTTPVQPASPKINLSDALKQLEAQLNVKLGFVYRQQTIRPARTDIGGWFAASGQAMEFSSDKFAAYLANLGRQSGITLANQADLFTATAYALSQGQSLDFAMIPAGGSTVVRTYCTAVLGESTANLEELTGKLAATYADARGWSDGGRIAFEHVDGGCQYTVWLSAADQVPSFGAICDNYYNCQVGTNVILNYDRWTGATTPWNTTGRTLEDYRTLMIDHETGHRLGFLDNPMCPGAGQPAPVMMQQSINLKGCVFNVWPLASEFAQLNSSLGL